MWPNNSLGQLQKLIDELLSKLITKVATFLVSHLAFTSINYDASCIHRNAASSTFKFFFSNKIINLKIFENSQKSVKLAPFFVLFYFIYLYLSVIIIILSCHVTIISKRALFKPTNRINPPPTIIFFVWFGRDEAFTLESRRLFTFALKFV